MGKMISRTDPVIPAPYLARCDVLIDLKLIMEIYLCGDI